MALDWLDSLFPDPARDLAPADIALHRAVELLRADDKLVQIFGVDRIEAMRRPNWADYRNAPRLSVVAYQDAIPSLATVEQNEVTLWIMAAIPKTGSVVALPGKPTVASIMWAISKPIRSERHFDIQVIRGGVRTTTQLAKRVEVQPVSLVPQSSTGLDSVEVWALPVRLIMNVNPDDYLVWNFSQGIS